MFLRNKTIEISKTPRTARSVPSWRHSLATSSELKDAKSKEKERPSVTVHAEIFEASKRFSYSYPLSS